MWFYVQNLIESAQLMFEKSCPVPQVAEISSIKSTLITWLFIHGDLMGFDGDIMVIEWDLMVSNGDFMGFYIVIP